MDATARKEFNMITRIWHGATPATKSDEYLTLMRTVAIPRLPLDPRQQGRLRATPYRGRYRTFFDGHVLGIRGGDPRLRRRRHQRGEILRLRQGFPARTGAVLHTLRDIRPVNAHRERDGLVAINRINNVTVSIRNNKNESHQTPATLA